VKSKKSAGGHNKGRTPPRPKRPAAVRAEMKAKQRQDDLDAAEELKEQQALRKKL
jgi:hypothetical protein